MQWTLGTQEPTLIGPKQPVKDIIDVGDVEGDTKVDEEVETVTVLESQFIFLHGDINYSTKLNKCSCYGLWSETSSLIPLPLTLKS